MKKPRKPAKQHFCPFCKSLARWGHCVVAARGARTRMLVCTNRECGAKF